MGMIFDKGAAGYVFDEETRTWTWTAKIRLNGGHSCKLASTTSFKEKLNCKDDYHVTLDKLKQEFSDLLDTMY